jgi:hypothetical protein
LRNGDHGGQQNEKNQGNHVPVIRSRREKDTQRTAKNRKKNSARIHALPACYTYVEIKIEVIAPL